jgi:hypothetical protein
MTQPTGSEPRTATGKRLWPGTILDRLQWRDAILAIEAEAYDQALGLLLASGSPGTHFPMSVLSFDNVKRGMEAVEKRIRAAIEAEAHDDDEHWHRGPSKSCSICRFAEAAASAAPLGLDVQPLIDEMYGEIERLREAHPYLPETHPRIGGIKYAIGKIKEYARLAESVSEEEGT